MGVRAERLSMLVESPTLITLLTQGEMGIRMKLFARDDLSPSSQLMLSSLR